MNLLAIVVSPRKGKATDTLVDKAIEGAKSNIIVTSGIIPPLLRKLCDEATPLIKQTAKDSLNAKTVDTMYAGDIEHRGVDYYLDRAFNLGWKLV